ncbi:MAG TPA: hypothetical protein DEP23_07050 [Ruminococcaceae bacterium]|nr:hypothetical protein [Oscillospiraceae bacterium]
MSITDMLPSYRKSHQHVTDRIHQLEAARDNAIAQRQYDTVSSLGNRLVALYDTRRYLNGMIKEIERYGKRI